MMDRLGLHVPVPASSGLDGLQDALHFHLTRGFRLAHYQLGPAGQLLRAERTWLERARHLLSVPPESAVRLDLGRELAGLGISLVRHGIHLLFRCFGCRFRLNV